jgi:hypothetical protein
MNYHGLLISLSRAARIVRAGIALHGKKSGLTHGNLEQIEEEVGVPAGSFASNSNSPPLWIS